MHRQRLIGYNLLFIFIASNATVVMAQGPWGAAPTVPDRQLESMRGGVQLPDGLNVDIGIDIQTQVNGMVVLHTVLSTADPGQGLRVYSGGPAAQNAGVTTVTLNRSGAATTLQPTSGALSQTIMVQSAPANTWPQYPDQTQLNVIANGPPVQTPSGSVQATQNGVNTSVMLTGNGLSIDHLIGDATGVVIANQLNNQSILSTTSVDVDLHGTWPATANAMFLVGNLALAAVRRP